MKRRFIMSVLVAALLVSAFGCGDSADTTDETTSTDTAKSTETEPEYIYPKLDLGGGDFTILNT